MIGKIVDEADSCILFTPATKTSLSGFFSNQRLVLLSPNEGLMGYLSKVPSPLDTFNDPLCLQKCKEVLALRTASMLSYGLAQG